MVVVLVLVVEEGRREEPRSLRDSRKQYKGPLGGVGAGELKGENQDPKV